MDSKIWRIIAAIAALGLVGSAVVAGTLNSWWADWWHSSSDFRLSLILIALGSSVVGGVAAAATYAWLEERAERRRWRAVAHVGASILTADALTAAQRVADLVRERGADVPRNVESLEDIDTIQQAVRSVRLASAAEVANVLSKFVEESWGLVRSSHL